MSICGNTVDRTVTTVFTVPMTSTASTTKFQTGSVVRYQDMANDSTYVVIEVKDCPWSTYKLRNVVTFEVSYTDGRQRGWTLVAE